MNFCEKQMTLWYIRGHEDRREQLRQERSRILSETRRDISKQAIQLAELDTTDLGRAVLRLEQDLNEAISDVQNKPLRDKLARSIMLNISGKREYPYERLDLPGISRNAFYRYRGQFIENIFNDVLKGV